MGEHLGVTSSSRTATPTPRPGPWQRIRHDPLPHVFTLIWLLQPLTAGPLLDQTVRNRSTPVTWTIAIGAWALWTLVLIASLLRHPVGLTVIRTGATAAAPLAVAAALAAGNPSTPAIVSAVAGVSVAAALALTPEVGASHISGAAYGDEVRLPLRVPVPLLMAAIPAALAAVLLPVVGVLLVAAGQPVVGGVIVVTGLAAAWVGVRALHGLSRRWVVFVPAGVVIHDPLSSSDAFLIRRSKLIYLGPAPVDLDLDSPDVFDATRRAAGPVLVIVVNEPIEVAALTDRRGHSEVRSVLQIAFTPTRPGAVIDTARRRGLIP